MSGCASRLLAWMAPRWPLAVLCVACLALWLAIPYNALTSDAATFGLMGNDLLRHGYWPTLTYGQNYLFSLTPYTYALWRLAVPSMTPAVALVLGGAVFSLSGLWLVGEALLTLQRRHGRPAGLALGVFCLLVVASPRYVLDIAQNISNEMSLFLIGLMVFSAARIEAGGASGSAWRRYWVILGAAAGFAVAARPNNLCYAVAMGLPLLLRRGAPGDTPRPRLARLAWLAAGAFAGYLPMLLHTVFRAGQWPFVFHLAVTIAQGVSDVRESACRVVETILPAIFGIAPAHPVLSVLAVAWVIVGLAAFAMHLLRRREPLSAVDVGWVVGSVTILAILVAVPLLSSSVECRRYCLHTYLAAVWLFCRFCVTARARLGGAAVAAVLVAALVTVSVPAWRASLAVARANDVRRRAIVTEVMPVLAALHMPILADYWNAYLIAFLSDGGLPIEAFPWNLVRTYGRLRREDFDGEVAWFISFGHSARTWQHLADEWGARTESMLRQEEPPPTFMGRRCELRVATDGHAVRDLLVKFHPRYFDTPYPPGSRPAAATMPAKGGAP